MSQEFKAKEPMPLTGDMVEDAYNLRKQIRIEADCLRENARAFRMLYLEGFANELFETAAFLTKIGDSVYDMMSGEVSRGLKEAEESNAHLLGAVLAGAFRGLPDEPSTPEAPCPV